MKRAIPLVLGAVAVLAPAAAFAHFILAEPAQWLVQNALGDPQKIAPCGGTSKDAGTPTNAITAFRGGDMLHIKIQETVFHPGHYRVALSVKDRAELPADPPTTTRDTEKGPWSVSAPIDANPKPPVLADGLFVHTTPQEKGSFQETDIKLPNINCDKCTVQVIQWMGNHGHNPDGDYSYHHCADVKITANKAFPIDKRWPGQ